MEQLTKPAHLWHSSSYTLDQKKGERNRGEEEMWRQRGEEQAESTCILEHHSPLLHTSFLNHGLGKGGGEIVARLQPDKGAMFSASPWAPGHLGPTLCNWARFHLGLPVTFSAWDICLSSELERCLAGRLCSSALCKQRRLSALPSVCCCWRLSWKQQG